MRQCAERATVLLTAIIELRLVGAAEADGISGPSKFRVIIGQEPILSLGIAVVVWPDNARHSVELKLNKHVQHYGNAQRVVEAVFYMIAR